MGAANCCKKPDEIVIEEVKYSATDNNKFTAIDQDSYPQDTEQVYRSNANAEDDNAQNQQFQIKIFMNKKVVLLKLVELMKYQ